MKIGFIGLGTMGLPMAVSILKKSGEPVIGWDLVPAQCEKFRAEGGLIAESKDELCEASDVILLSLPTNDIVKSTVRELIQKGREGQILVDLSSTLPDIIKELYAEAKEKGISLVDSPVSGGDKAAAEGALAVMCGGDKAAYDKVLPILQCIGKKENIALMGGPGCGDVAKLANNMIAAINLAGMAEAFVYASKAGIDANTLFSVLRGGGAGSAVMEARAPKMINHDFEPSARLNIHYKDVKNALEFGKDLEAEMPLTDAAAKLMEEMIDEGHGADDHSILLKWYEDRMKTTI